MAKGDNIDHSICYRELVGSLLYISIGTRPDICYTVNYLSQFQNCCTKLHFNHLKRVALYLKGTRDMKLKFSKHEESPVVECYVDADWVVQY